ncbi:MAG: DUF1963 domain-containing protein [Polyangiaceae bacterium]
MKRLHEYVRMVIEPDTGRRVERLDLEKLCPREATDRPHVHLLPCRVDESESMNRGCRLGGLPLLPPGARWPRSDDGPLSFVGQLDFDELWSLHKGTLPMPARGILTFFCDMRHQVAGATSSRAGRWAVGYANEVTPTAEHRARSFPTRPLDGEITLPPAHALDEPTAAEPEHRAMWGRRLDGGRFVELTLGIELGSHDWDGTVATLAAVEIRGLDVVGTIRRAADWTVLWQIDTDDEIGLHWLGGGRAFLLVRNDDLARARFRDVMLCIDRPR